jgi:hypothetical protein
MPDSGVSTRLRVDTFLILSSMKPPLIVGVAVYVAMGIAVDESRHRSINFALTL